MLGFRCCVGFFSSCREQGLFSRCNVQKSSCAGFSPCRAWHLGPVGFHRSGSEALRLNSCCTKAQSCLTVWDPTDCSMPSSSVLHYLLEFAQIHVHWVGDAILSSHLLPSLSPFAFYLSQHQGLETLSSLYSTQTNEHRTQILEGNGTLSAVERFPAKEKNLKFTYNHYQSVSFSSTEL